MKTQITNSSVNAPDSQTSHRLFVSQRGNDKGTTRLLTILALLLLFTIGRSAFAASQLNPFEKANEAMINQQTAVAEFVAEAFGVDANSKLNFTSYVDPAGQNFNFTLASGAKYFGRSMTATASGSLDSSGTWHITSTGTYDTVPWSVKTTIVPTRPSSGSADSASQSSLDFMGGLFDPTRIIINWGGGGGLGGHTECDAEVSDDFEDFEICTVYDANDRIINRWYQLSYGVYRGNGFDYGFAANGVSGGTKTGGRTFPDGSLGSFVMELQPAFFECPSCMPKTLYSNFGSGGSLYQSSSGWQISGNDNPAGSLTAASRFVPNTSGSVSQIHLGVGYGMGVNSFYAALYTDNGGLPGVQIARWDNLSSNSVFGLCCGIITIDNVSGVALTGGQSYFMVLGPMNTNDTSFLRWNWNGQNAIGLQLYSTDGGRSWGSNGQAPLGAFDVLGTSQRGQ